MNETCSFCGQSVAPGSGKWVNRIPDVNNPETRKAEGRPTPDGEFVCSECSDATFTSTPEELAAEILERLDVDPAEVMIYSVSVKDVAKVLAEKLLESEVDLGDLAGDDLQAIFQAGVAGVEEIDWRPAVSFRLEQARDERFYCKPDPEPDEGPLVEQGEYASRLDGWLEAAYEDRSCGE